MKRYPKNYPESSLMPLLTLAQKQNEGWIPKKAIEYIANFLKVSEIKVLEIATFYSMFSLNPIGKNVISVCTNVSCMLRGSDEILTYLEKKLKIKVGESTKDNKFYLKNEMECLAACNGAPMMQVNHINHENLTFERIDDILDGLNNE